MSKPFKHSTTYYRRLRAATENEQNLRTSTSKNVIPFDSGCSTSTDTRLSLNVQQECSTSQLQVNILPQIENPLQTTLAQQNNDNLMFTGEENLSTSQPSSHPDSNYHTCVVSDNDTDDDESIRISKKIKLRDDLQQWALEHNVKHSAINDLLMILRRNSDNSHLPKDARTLLRTPRYTNMTTMGTGSYWYHGIKNCLLETKQKVGYLLSPLKMTVNIDGVPTAKSAKTEFWPILIKLNGLKVCPLVIAIYYGSSKPPINDFLRPFVDEMLLLLNNGLEIDGKSYDISINCFVCDTPARCLVKGTIGFNGYNSCMKCTIIGEYDRRGRHMTFPRVDMPLRTNHSFRNRLDPDHHKHTTPIEDLPIDLIEDFVVADALHLLHLGIMKRCLLGWMNGTFNFRSKWSARDIQEISSDIMDIKSTTPSEVHEGRMRGLETVHFWKGAEFRNFLMYFGPVLLRHYLASEVYDHFLLLFCATIICSCDQYKSYLHLAQTLYETYIEQYINIYGYDSISSNVHNLCHIVNDTIKFGPLPNISTYPFESMLNNIKNLLRKGETPLQQISNRIQELSHMTTEEDTPQVYPTVNRAKFLQNEKKIFTMIWLKKNYCLRCTVKDKWFLSTDNCVVEMQYGEIIKGNFIIAGKKIKKTFDFFEMPIKSRHLNIHATMKNYEQEELQLYELNKVKCKLISIRDRNIIVFLPILSTLQ